MAKASERTGGGASDGTASVPVFRSNIADGIAAITLNRPAQRNSLSLDVLVRLKQLIDETSADRSVKAVILRANGPAFSAGHDLKELDARRSDEDRGRAFFVTVMAACSDVMQAIVRSPKPFIAAVQGTATAAGCQLVASCDLAVASEEAGFCTPGVNIGLFCSTPMVALSRNVARKHAMEMLLLGDTISAETAAQYGLVNRVVAADAVEATALAFAHKIAVKSNVTVAIGKEAFYRQAEMALEDAYTYASAVMVDNMLEADACEGIRAFLEKRHPQWGDSALKGPRQSGGE